MRLLITGAAGFIGFHVAKLRLEQGDQVIGIDNLNDYYDVNLKKSRLKLLQAYPNFVFYAIDIADAANVKDVFQKEQPERVVNLAAQAGVRYSLINPELYVQSNVVGFTNIIEACRHNNIQHLVYASTSSVYGANLKQPNQETDAVNHPLTIYAATKKSNELIAHCYSHLYQLPTTGLRFFTVYGPWGRPDMAFFAFTQNILAGKPIKIFNHGKMLRDFTYIDDVAVCVSKAIDKTAAPDAQWSGFNPNAASSNVPYRIYNVGCGNPVNLMDYIEAIEEAASKKAIKEFLPMQAGDVLSTHADAALLKQALGYQPVINYKEGIKQFVDWYINYYH